MMPLDYMMKGGHVNRLRYTLHCAVKHHSLFSYMQ